MMQRWQTYILTLIALTVAVAFQNCIVTGSKTTDSSHTQSSVNGEGYDGKLFNFIPIGGICADGNPIASTILVKDGIGLMIRQNCRDLDLHERFEVPLVFSNQDKRILIYQGEEYLLQYIQYSALKRDSSSQLLAVGTVWNAGHANLAAITHLQADGNPSWSLTYDHDFDGQTLQVSSIAAVGDGWLASGNPVDLRLDSALQTPQPGLLAKFDKNGIPQWTRSYGDNLTEGQKLHFRGVLELNDGRNLVAATFETYAPGASVLSGSTPSSTISGLLVIDANGTIVSQQWWKQFSINELHAMTDGSSLILGRYNGLSMLAKINDSGVQWSRSLDIKIESVRVLTNGQIGISGYQERGSSLRTCNALALLNADGTLVWARSFASADESGMSMLHDLVEKPGGGFYAVGFADRAAGRMATSFSVDANGNLLSSTELKPGFSARWKKALLLAPDTLWTSLVNIDFTQVENSLNEILMRLNPLANPPCASCVNANQVAGADILVNASALALESTSPNLNWAFTPRSLRPRTLGYPIFVSP